MHQQRKVHVLYLNRLMCFVKGVNTHLVVIPHGGGKTSSSMQTAIHTLLSPLLVHAEHYQNRTEGCRTEDLEQCLPSATYEPQRFLPTNLSLLLLTPVFLPSKIDSGERRPKNLTIYGTVASTNTNTAK